MLRNIIKYKNFSKSISFFIVSSTIIVVQIFQGAVSSSILVQVQYFRMQQKYVFNSIIYGEQLHVVCLSNIATTAMIDDIQRMHWRLQFVSEGNQNHE